MLFIITFISIIIYGLLSEINWMDGMDGWTAFFFDPTVAYTVGHSVNEVIVKDVVIHSLSILSSSPNQQR